VASWGEDAGTWRAGALPRRTRYVESEPPSHNIFAFARRFGESNARVDKLRARTRVLRKSFTRAWWRARKAGDRTRLRGAKFVPAGIRLLTFWCLLDYPLCAEAGWEFSTQGVIEPCPEKRPCSNKSLGLMRCEPGLAACGAPAVK